MKKMELWGFFPGGRHGRVPTSLTEEIQRLVAEHGAEAVAQVAVLETLIMPYDRRQADLNQNPT